jgi:uncharacterized protein (TIGR03086 family)
MDSKELFAKCVEHASPCIRHLSEDQLTNSTPCSEWDLKALLNHMVNELLWVPDMLAGRTVAEVGSKYDGDVLGSDPASAWTRAADAALVAVKNADLSGVAHVSYGDVPLEQYLTEVSNDMYIHGWDVAQAIKCTLLMDQELAEALYDKLLPRKQEIINSGVYGTLVDVADDSSASTKLLALMGRKG